MANGGKFLIAAGTAKYDAMPEDLQLPSVIEDLARVSAWFTARGYCRVLESLGNSPTVDELRRGIAAWFNDPARRPDDHVVFYYSGHGEVVDGGDHYLLGRDSIYNKDNQLVTGFAYGDHELAGAIASSPVQHVLVVLDTCFSMAGVYGFSQGARTRVALQRWDRSLPHGIHVIAAAREKEVAEPGAFSEALSEVLDNKDSRLGGSAQEFLKPDAVCSAVNAHVLARNFAQSAVYALVTPVSGDIAELIPNPRYDCRRTIDIELQDHWLPKVRSGAVETTRWYFTGREQALSELVDWLKRPKGDGRARVVTGSAGVGKSAVLAHLVALADRDLRTRLEENGELGGLSPNLIPPAGCFDVALHARGQTLDRIVARIADAANCPGATAAKLVKVLENRDTPFNIVIDALDEAFDPLRINSQLLRRIASIENVKLLVGLRSDGRAANPAMRVRGLGLNSVEIDLDSPRYLGAADVVTYVTRRLLAEEEVDRPTPYRGNRAGSEQVARAVAATSGGVFLLAKVIADMLVAESAPRNPARAEQMLFPSGIGDAFKELLAGFDRDGDVGQQRVVDVLLPLAYAEGAGLPWGDIWAPVASALAEVSYIDDDIDAIFKRGTGLFVEATENGRSVYRLYHQELADYLRTGRDMRRDQASMLEALIATVPMAVSGQAEWLRADSYVTTHLAAHAAHVGGLTDLIADPLYVAVADRQRLIGVLGAIVSDDVAQAARAYRLAYHHLAEPDPAVRLSYLELIARITPEAPATWTADTAPTKPWRVDWAQWRQEPPHSRVVVDRQQPRRQGYMSQRSGNFKQWSVTAAATARLGSIPVIIAGSGSGTLQIRRLADSMELAPAVVAHEAGVDQIAAIDIDGRLAILSTAGDGRLSYWEPMSDVPPRALYEKEGGWSFRALSVVQVQGRWIAAVGGGDHMVRLVDVEAGQVLDWVGRLDDESVYAVAMCEVDREIVIAAGGSRGLIRTWRLELDLSKAKASFDGDIGNSVEAISIFAQGASWCVAAVNSRGQVVQWSFAGQEKGRYDTGHAISRAHGYLTAACFATCQDDTVLIAADFDGEVRLLAAATGKLIMPAVHTDAGKVASVALTDDVRPLLVTGEVDGVMRIWWNDDRPDKHLDINRVDQIRAMASGNLNDEHVVAVGTIDGQVHVLEAQSGKERISWQAHRVSLSAVAYVKSDSPRIITAGDQPLDIVSWRIDTPKPVKFVMASSAHSHAVGIVTVDDRDMVAIQRKEPWIELLDVDRGAKFGPDIPGHEHSALCLLPIRLNGRLVLASSGMDKWIRLWDVERGFPYSPPINTDNYTAAMAFASWKGRTVLFSGAYSGKVHIWDPDTGAEFAPAVAAHGDGINTVVLGTFEGQIVGLSAGVSGRLVAWRPSGEILREIDFGIWIYRILPLGGDALLIGAGKGLVKIVLPGFEFQRPGSLV